MGSKNNPQSRQTNVVVQELGSELLIYDLQVNKAYCLNETATLIYQLCDGTNSVAGIKEAIGSKLNQQVSRDVIHLAINQLRQENLLSEDTDKNGEIKFNGLSRRQVIRKAGLTSLIALPVISSLVAPTAAMAQSGVVCTAGTIPAGNNVGANRAVGIGSTCADPSTADASCDFLYGSLCCSGNAVGRSCIQDIDRATGLPRTAVYNCKCA